jgi:hypothetical protein
VRRRELQPRPSEGQGRGEPPQPFVQPHDRIVRRGSDVSVKRVTLHMCSLIRSNRAHGFALSSAPAQNRPYVLDDIPAAYGHDHKLWFLHPNGDGMKFPKEFVGGAVAG